MALPNLTMYTSTVIDLYFSKARPLSHHYKIWWSEAPPPPPSYPARKTTENNNGKEGQYQYQEKEKLQINFKIHSSSPWIKTSDILLTSTLKKNKHTRTWWGGRVRTRLCMKLRTHFEARGWHQESFCLYFEIGSLPEPGLAGLASKPQKLCCCCLLNTGTLGRGLQGSALVWLLGVECASPTFVQQVLS